MKINRRQASVTLAATGFAPLGLAQPSATKPPADIPAEHFFRRRQLSMAQINPAGTHVALCVGGDGGRRRLMMLDLATLKVEPVAALDVSDVGYLHWVNDRRVLFGAWDEDAEESRGAVGRGYFAVDADGSNFKQLRQGGRLIEQGGQRADQVLISWAQDSSEGAGFLKLMQLDTRSGKIEELDVPPWSEGFLIGDDDQPEVAITARGERSQIRWREGAKGRDWRVLRDFDRFVGDAMTLLGLAPDGKFYVAARRGHDQSALYTYDPKADRLSDQPLLAVAQFDIQPDLIRRDGQLLGVRFLADALTTVWFDPVYKALQSRLDERLPDTSNVLQIPRRGASAWSLVWAFSDCQPGVLYAHNRETDKLVLLGRTLPHIDPARMSTMDFVTYKARDSLDIPAFVTLPRSSKTRKNLPLVVYVHGGPWLRDGHWAWNREVQFLASRGYAVIQPEFRGSTGYGEKLFKAGWRQWGQAMQDDLADAAKWAIAQGIADPKRIAIVGASYGGYAAMMGLVRHPDVFACAVNWVGVTDMELFFTKNWGDNIPDVAKTYGMPKLIGDPKTDAEMLRANSPVLQAAKITKPVLMAYGRLDRRVPIAHGERMRDALKAHNPNVEWVVYDKEGHGWYRVDTNVDFWGRVERFLGQHLAA